MAGAEGQSDDDESFRCCSSSSEDEFISDYNEIERYEGYYFSIRQRHRQFVYSSTGGRSTFVVEIIVWRSGVA